MLVVPSGLEGLIAFLFYSDCPLIEYLFDSRVRARVIPY